MYRAPQALSISKGLAACCIIRAPAHSQCTPHDIAATTTTPAGSLPATYRSSLVQIYQITLGKFWRPAGCTIHDHGYADRGQEGLRKLIVRSTYFLRPGLFRTPTAYHHLIHTARWCDVMRPSTRLSHRHRHHHTLRVQVLLAQSYTFLAVLIQTGLLVVLRAYCAA